MSTFVKSLKNDKASSPKRRKLVVTSSPGDFTLNTTIVSPTNVENVA